MHPTDNATGYNNTACYNYVWEFLASLGGIATVISTSVGIGATGQIIKKRKIEIDTNSLVNTS